MWIIKHLGRGIVRGLRAFIMRLKVCKKYGISLPSGAGFFGIENISIGKDFSLGSFCQFFARGEGCELSIGNKVGLNCNVIVNADCGGRIFIGNNVIIGPMTILRAANHRFDNMDVPIREQGHAAGEIVIEEDVWIGANVVVLPNVKIGRSAIVGAGSIVTKDVPEYSIVVGNPAKVKRSRNSDDQNN